MKYYTEALVNDKKKKRVSAFFLGDRRRTSYYQARHREEDLYLLWIEGIHLGKMICYPCVLERGAEQMVFENGSLDISKQNNQELVDAWIQTVNPENILTDFEVTPFSLPSLPESVEMQSGGASTTMLMIFSPRSR